MFAQCTSERDALMSMYNTMNGPNWTTKTNWGTGSNNCNWFGIICNNAGNVIALNLDNNNVTGQLTSQIECLPFLQTLSLNSNQMTSTVPVELCALNNLQYLQTNFAGFIGELPTCICEMPHLQYFYMENNMLTGAIPTCVAGMTYLREMHLYCNQLTGTIPTGFEQLNYLVELRVNCNDGLDCTSALSSKTNFIFLCGDFQCANCLITPASCPTTINVPNCGVYVREGFQ
uniref:Cyst wall protein n=1 Tax=Trepomonas sp. PC1 TaxID=1076344 RepID=A0A146KKJ2_9EUKA|eukprot:JAP96105.1 Cyst wall protein [Trepomonas sp. PC1]